MSSKTPYILLLCGALVFVVGAGRFLFFSPDTDVRQNVTPSPSTAVTNNEPNQTPAASTPPRVKATCAEELAAEAKAKKTSYEKGSIVVGFVANTSYEEAKAALAVYGLKAQDEAHAEEYYPTQRLITAAVPSGDEFIEICRVRADADVRLANLNILFELHE